MSSRRVGVWPVQQTPMRTPWKAAAIGTPGSGASRSASCSAKSSAFVKPWSATASWGVQRVDIRVHQVTAVVQDSSIVSPAGERAEAHARSGSSCAARLAATDHERIMRGDD